MGSVGRVMATNSSQRMQASGSADGELARRQEALLAFIESISSELELRPLLERMVLHACRLIGADDGTIGLVDPAGPVVRVEAAEQVPRAVADFLKSENLPAQLRMAPDPELQALPWDQQSLLEITEGPARESDPISVTGALAGIAETGTLMLLSGAAGPTTLNFLPETHIVVLPADRVVAAYEDGWDLVRQAHGPGQMPRTVNFITGPSRTADIEQTIQLGAHGPRRQYEFAFREHQAGRTRQPPDGRHRQDAERERDRPQASFHERRDQDGQDQGGERQQHQHDERGDLVEDAPHEAADQTDRAAEDEAEANCREPDDE